MKINRQKFTLDKMTGKLNEIVMKNTSHMSSQVGLKLPKLKKVNSKAELPKIQLPKLKKVTDEVGV